MNALPRVRFVLLALAAVASLLLGLLAADPIGAARTAGEVQLRAAGGRAESFRAKDGTWLRAMELGPLAAERPVVLLHGIGTDLTYWAQCARTLRRAGRTVLLLDMPGSGRSEPPATPEGYGLAGRVAAVETLQEALGLDRFDLVGHSLGGWTAGLYALRNPHRVARLVLVDAGGFTLPDDPDGLRRALTPVDRPGARHLLDLLFFRKPFPPAGFAVDGLAGAFRRPNVVETAARVTEADGLLGREALLPRGTVLIWGEKETLFPVADARRAASRIRGGRLLVITGVGHDGPLEAPRAFDEALARALSG